MSLAIRSWVLLAVLSSIPGLAQDSYEPNNSIGEAASLTLGSPVEVSLHTTTDQDFFRFTVGSVGTLQIQFDDLPEGMPQPEHRVYYQGSIEYSRDSTFAVTPNTYTVGFWRADGGSGSTEAFRFTVRFTPIGVSTGSTDSPGSEHDEEPDPKPDPPDATEDSSPHRWVGTLEVESTLVSTGNRVGQETHRWSYEIQWRESRRLEVHDTEGRLTGEFVELIEDASAWTATSEGSYQNKDSRTVISGEGSGSGSIQHGWIYFSLSDEDPLAGILENGTYMSHGNQAVQYETLIQHISPHSTHESRLPKHAAFNMGRLNWYPYQAKDPLRADDIAPYLTGVDNPGGDSRLRTLEDGVMRGSYETSLPWAPNATHRAEWRIARQLNVRATLEAPSRDWRPMGPPKPNRAELTVDLLEPEGIAGKLRFTLSEVSSEKGYALNAGDEGDDELDYEFDMEEMSEHYDDPFHPDGDTNAWRIESKDLLTRSTVTIKALDYGAWARLKAEVNVDGQWYDVEIEGGGFETTLPLDTDEDRIADGWEQDHGIADQDGAGDEDDQPEIIESKGDGFSNYEEYRGFEVQGIWTDTDPLKRDVFVHDSIGFGTGPFDSTGLEVHVIDGHEYDANRVVNFRRGYASQGTQKGLLLTEGSLNGADGQVFPAVGSPNVVQKVVVDLVRHASFLAGVDPSQYESLQDYAEAGVAAGDQGILEDLRSRLQALKEELAALEANHTGPDDDLDYIIDKEYLENDIRRLKEDIQSREESLEPRAQSAAADIEQTIAHELGHGVAIPHHGRDWVTCPGEPDFGGTPNMGGKWSGVLTCIMRYHSAYEYIDTSGACRDYTDPKPPQTHYCQSKGDADNTGILGPASAGECMQSIVLKGEVWR